MHFFKKQSWQQKENSERGFVADPRLNLWIAEEISALLDLKSLAPGSKVLDLACGTGAISRHLGQLWPNLNFLGLDLGEKFLARSSAPNVSLQKLNTESLGLEANSIAAGFSYALIQYLELAEVEKYLAQLAHALKPGASFLLGEVPRERGYFNSYIYSLPRSVWLKAAILCYMNSLYRYRIHSTARLSDAFQRAGFSYQELNQDSRLPYASTCKHFLLKKQAQ